jgi:hypothetical protein
LFQLAIWATFLSCPSGVVFWLVIKESPTLDAFSLVDWTIIRLCCYMIVHER